MKIVVIQTSSVEESVVALSTIFGTPPVIQDSINIFENEVSRLNEVKEEAETVSAMGQRLGLGQRIALRQMFIRSRINEGKSRLSAILDYTRISDSQWLDAVSQVAAAKGLVVPSAIGDGKLLEQFLAFISEHWDEILAILLKLIGL